MEAENLLRRRGQVVQIVSNMLRGEGGLVVCMEGGHEGEALAVWEGAGAASVPDIEGGAGEEEDLFFHLVADAMGSWTRHLCYCGWRGLRNAGEVVEQRSDGVVVIHRVYVYIEPKGQTISADGVLRKCTSSTIEKKRDVSS